MEKEVKYQNKAGGLLGSSNYDHTPLLLELGFTTAGYEPCLEKFITKIENGAKDDQRKITVNNCPELIRSTIIALRHRDKKLSSQAAVTRCLTRHGLQILQRIHGVNVLKERRRLAYETGSECDRLSLSRHFYDFKYRISMTTNRITVYAAEWVAAGITELACDIGTSLETIAIMSLIAACSTSKEWIPDRHLRLMYNELIHFVIWIDHLVKEHDSVSLV